MPTFKQTEDDPTLLPEGVYIAQVDDCQQLLSKKGNEMHKLTLAVLPKRRRLYAYIVFSDKTQWQATAFCKSAGLEMPDDKTAEVNLTETDCLRRIVYVLVEHEDGNVGVTRAKVSKWLTREAALKRSPLLESVPLPLNVPPPRKLAAEGKPPATRLPAPAAMSVGNDVLDAEPDDIPF